MKVFITGMHRSGTSMLTRMLNICGLYLGPHDRLMQGKPDNPEGFWEHLDLGYINNSLLDIADGAWDLPPLCDDEFWVTSDKLEACRKGAREILKQMQDKENVGVKDPRFCLTMPFWLDLFPSSKILVCLRNPIEVAQSLKDRNGISELLALKLWRHYYEKLMESTQPGQRLVVSYAALIGAPEKEFKRVTDWLDLNPSEESVEAACAVIKKDLFHHRIDALETSDQLDIKRNEGLKKIYVQLIEEAQLSFANGGVKMS